MASRVWVAAKRRDGACGQTWSHPGCRLSMRYEACRCTSHAGPSVGGLAWGGARPSPPCPWPVAGELLMKKTADPASTTVERPRRLGRARCRGQGCGTADAWLQPDGGLLSSGPLVSSKPLDLLSSSEPTSASPTAMEPVPSARGWVWKTRSTSSSSAPLRLERWTRLGGVDSPCANVSS